MSAAKSKTAAISVPSFDLDGMGAQQAPAPVAPAPSPVSVSQRIPLDDIRPNPNNPRKYFNKLTIEEIAEQFNNPLVGQLEAITVVATPNGSTPYMLVSGENRYKAARLAGWTDIRADIITEKKAGLLQMVLSNEQRTDMSAFDKAVAYQMLMDEQGYEQQDVAKLIGKSDSYVSDHRKLLTMPAMLKAAANDGKALTVKVLTGLRKLVEHNDPEKAASKAAKALAVKNTELIAAFIDERETISSGDVTELSKALKVKGKAKPKETTTNVIKGHKIDGKPFEIVKIVKDVMWLKIGNDTEATQYKITPVAEPVKSPK